MTRLSFASLRFRLLLLVLLVILPSLGLTLYAAREEYRLARQQAQVEALQLTRLAAASEEQLLEGTGQLLIALAQLPEVRREEVVVCNALFINLLKRYPRYVNLGVIDEQGDVFCSAVPLVESVNVADRSYFQIARDTLDFAIGDYQVGRVTGKASLNFGYPVLDEQGRLQAVVFAALDLAWFNQIVAAEAQLPEGASLLVIDRRGTVLARHPEADKWIGQSVSETPLVRTILSQEEGAAELLGLDGVKRLYGFTRVGNASEAGLYVSVGLPEKTALAEANDSLTRNLAGLGLIGALGLLVVWIGGDVFSLRQIRALLSATQRLGSGELNARTGLQGADGELGQLAHAFDEMAEALERREALLRETEAGVNRRVVERTRQLFSMNKELASEIAERERVEASLRESQERYRNLVEQATDIIYQADPQGRFTFVNSTALTLLGYSEAEVVGRHYLELIQPAYRPAVRRFYTRQFLKKIPNTHYEFPALAKDGREVWLEQNVQLLLDQDQVTGVQAIARDITLRKQAQAAARRSEERFQIIAWATNDVIWDWDLATDAVWWNDKVRGLLGYPAREIGSDVNWWIEHLHPEDKEKTVSKIRAIIDQDAAFWSGEYRLRRKDGSYAYVFDRGYMVPDEQGRPAHIISSLMEITERKQIERALEESERRFRLLVTHAPVGIFQVNLEGVCLFVNERWCEITGFSPEQVIGHDLRSTLPPAEGDRLYADWKATKNTLREFTFEYTFQSPQGKTRHVYGETIAVRNQMGEIVEYMGTLADITERKETEAALQLANAKLKDWVDELERRAREITLLNQMGDLLQTCQTAEEAYRVVAHSAQQLFPGERGMLYLINASRNILEAMALWGESAADRSTRLFEPGECWALRRGRVHLVEDPGSGLLCRHVNESLTTGYICVPMMVQGEVLGVLHFQINPNGHTASASSGESLGETKQRLAVTVAEHIALSLANLRLRETLRSQSIRDPLTGLYNRRYMEESLDREMYRATRRDTTLGIIMLDIDHFKHFNDTFGHDAGDLLLQEFGRLLQMSIRGEDIACRYGGEEFTLILPEASLETALERAEQLREQASELRLRYRGQFLEAVTLSLGVAVFPTHGATKEAALNAADVALYRAKHQGRDQVVSAA